MALCDPDFDEFDRGDAPEIELTTLTSYRDELGLPGRLPAPAAGDDARRGARRGRHPPAARRRDREVRARHLLLQRRPRARVGGGGALPGRLAPRRRHLRPGARDERRGGGARSSASAGRPTATASGSSTSPTRTWSGTPASIPAAVSAIEAVDACLGRGRRRRARVGGRLHRHRRPRQRRADARARRLAEHRPLPQPGPAGGHGRGARARDGGILADVAPTALALLDDRAAGADDRAARWSPRPSCPLRARAGTRPGRGRGRGPNPRRSSTQPRRRRSAGPARGRRASPGVPAR